MENDTGGEIIEEFVGLRPKLYSCKMFEALEEMKCKGIKKSVIEKNIQFKDYKECFFSEKEQLRSMNVIRSHNHDVFTKEVNEIALSADDDKRIILNDGISHLSTWTL